jgi:hypothetical protein
MSSENQRPARFGKRKESGSFRRLLSQRQELQKQLEQKQPFSDCPACLRLTFQEGSIWVARLRSLDHLLASNRRKWDPVGFSSNKLSTWAYHTSKTVASKEETAFWNEIWVLLWRWNRHKVAESLMVVCCGLHVGMVISLVAALCGLKGSCPGHLILAATQGCRQVSRGQFPYFHSHKSLCAGCFV